MHVVVAYDIARSKARGRMFRMLSELGLHTQLSVFECDLDARQRRLLLDSAGDILEEGDSLVLYPLCSRCARSVRVLGQGILMLHADWQVI